jgi:NADH dehydrogenase [ubiquinone] 1 alpha subcomplex assembly factor 7
MNRLHSKPTFLTLSSSHLLRGSLDPRNKSEDDNEGPEDDKEGFGKRSTPLHSLIFQEIQDKGPMTVPRFMELALHHPDHGYYVSQKVLGKQGDFITASELTQVFGELLGLWFVDLWQKLGKPLIQLAELGPGRGLMMQDMLRIFKKFPELYRNLKIYLIEVSPFLKSIQQDILKDEPIEWITDLKNLPENRETFFIANEFFDALPIDQCVQKDNQWSQRYIDAKDGVFVFRDESLPIKEECPDYVPYMDEINQRLLKNKGGAIIIDYGDDVPKENRTGDTLQAIHHHKNANVLENPGEQDLTHHVSFAALKQYIDPSLKVMLSTQADFLLSLGIEEWVEKLCQSADATNAAKLKIAATRLIAPQEMGRLFKVLTIETI